MRIEAKPTVRKLVAIGLLVVGSFLTAAPSPSKQDGTIALSSQELRHVAASRLPGLWRYGGADPTADDSRWPLAPTDLNPLPADFTGTAVFHLHLDVPDDTASRPLALRLRQYGSSTVTVDGRPVAAWGSPDGTRPHTPLASAVFTLSPGPHVLSVRYVCPEAARYVNAGVSPGFVAWLGLSESALPAEAGQVSAASAATWLFTGVFLAFAVLHGSLFAFDRAMRENVWFALLCASNASLAYFMFARDTVTDPRFVLVSEPAMNVTGLLFAASAVLFVRDAFGPPPSRRLLLAVALTLFALGPWAALRPAASLLTVFLVMLASCVETLRCVVLAVVRRRPGAVLIGSGAACLAAGFGIGLLTLLGFLPRDRVTSSYVPFGSVVVMLVLTSLHLSRRFAAVNAELRHRIVEVERLSEEKVLAERDARREELSRRLLESEYARKSEELEEARRLQTSMLPKAPPALPNLVIAAAMTTATEVGGDYYDFDVSETGAVTIAIGDATGHGMRAGTLVTATKSLFGVLSRESGLTEALDRSAVSLRRMNLRSLTMALTLVRIREGSLRIAAAGMPPVLVHRVATSTVESVLVSGVPLGSSPRFRYTETEVALGIGDTVLLMSDGLPERLNRQDDMIGYERTAELFLGVATLPPAELVSRLMAAADVWSEGRAPEDDVTLVVLRRVT